MSRAGITAQTRYQLEQIKPYIAISTPKEISKITGIKTDKVRYLLSKQSCLLTEPSATNSTSSRKAPKQKPVNTGQNWGDSPDDFFFTY